MHGFVHIHVDLNGSGIGFDILSPDVHSTQLISAVLHESVSRVDGCCLQQFNVSDRNSEVELVQLMAFSIVYFFSSMKKKKGLESA